MYHLVLDGKLNTEVKENTESHLLHLHSDLKNMNKSRKTEPNIQPVIHVMGSI